MNRQTDRCGICLYALLNLSSLCRRIVKDVLRKVKNCVSNDSVHRAAVVAEARSVCGHLMERTGSELSKPDVASRWPSALSLCCDGQARLYSTSTDR